MKTSLHSSTGQALVEFAIVVSLLCVVALGVVEVSYGLLDEHIVSRLSREGANLISRDTSLGAAANALSKMSTRPVNFASSSTVIFSVIKKVATTGSTNYNQPVLFERYQYGSFPATSTVHTAGAGSFGGAPDYEATNSDNDASLRVTTMPPGLVLPTGGMLYVAEIFSAHTRITPLDHFGIMVPTTLYSVAYF